MDLTLTVYPVDKLFTNQTNLCDHMESNQIDQIVEG